MWDWQLPNLPVWQQKRELPQNQQILRAIALEERARRRSFKLQLNQQLKWPCIIHKVAHRSIKKH